MDVCYKTASRRPVVTIFFSRLQPAVPTATASAVFTAFAVPKNTLAAIMADTSITAGMPANVRRQLDMLKLQLNQAEEVVLESLAKGSANAK